MSRTRVRKLARRLDDPEVARLLYLAGCLAKMQRTGPCSRDFLPDCIEPVTDEHLQWAEEILNSLPLFDRRTVGPPRGVSR